MAEMRRTVSFRVESAPSSGGNGLEPCPYRLLTTPPNTAPVKTRPGILRSSSTPANEILQISGQKLTTTPPTKGVLHDATKDHKLNTTKVAPNPRLVTSHKMHEEVKCLRYETSKIREALLKVEEEV